MTAPRLKLLRPLSGSPRIVNASMPKWPSWFLLVWWVFTLEIVRIPGLDQAGSTASAVESGSLSRTLLVLTFGAVGASMLPMAVKRLDRAGWRLLTLLTAYLAWSALSFTWSEAPQLTVRRLLLAALLILGAFGLGAGYYGRSENARGILARDLLLAGLVAGASTWISALSRGGVDALAGDWELVPVGVGTTIGFPMLLAALVSVYGRHTSAVPAPFSSHRTLGVVLIGALVTLVSLRKRVLLAVSLLATATLSLVFHRSGARRAMLVRLIAGISMIAIVGVLLGVDIAGSATPIVTRGEQELDLETLTGRVPLWEELIDQASERPWTGVGFGAFWTPERMANVEAAVGWPAVNAHNGFVDEVLATGLPGLVLLFGAWVAAIRALARRAGQGDGFALLGAVWLGCFLLLNTTGTLTQFLFQFPFYSALVLAFAAFTSDSASHVSHSTAES